MLFFGKNVWCCEILLAKYSWQRKCSCGIYIKTILSQRVRKLWRTIPACAKSSKNGKCHSVTSRDVQSNQESLRHCLCLSCLNDTALLHRSVIHLCDTTIYMLCVYCFKFSQHAVKSIIISFSYIVFMSCFPDWKN